MRACLIEIVLVPSSMQVHGPEQLSNLTIVTRAVYLECGIGRSILRGL
jgi:hypothetical protein